MNSPADPFSGAPGDMGVRDGLRPKHAARLCYRSFNFRCSSWVVRDDEGADAEQRDTECGVIPYAAAERADPRVGVLAGDGR